MNSLRTDPTSYEFCFPEKDTLVRVEVTGDVVTVRATRDNLSEQRKASFVRELAAEGFISDRYQWFCPAGPESYLGVRWLIDYRWLVIPAEIVARARQFMLRLLATSGLLWLFLMAMFVAG